MKGTDQIQTLAGNHHISYSEVCAHAHFESEDTVVVSGTLVEGMGNPLSDIDAIVFCKDMPTVGAIQKSGFAHRMVSFGDMNHEYGNMAFGSQVEAIDPKKIVINTYDIVNKWGTRCDVEYVSYNDLFKMISKVNSAFEKTQTNFGHISPGLSEVELKLLHRIGSGKIFFGTEYFEELRESLNLHKLRYILYRSSLVSWSDFQDIIGFSNNGDISATLSLCDSYLWDIAKSYSHLLGSTNPGRKWTPHYLKKYLGSESEIFQKFQTLTSRRSIVSQSDALKHARETLTLTDVMYKNSTILCNENQGYVPPQNVLSAIQAIDNIESLSGDRAAELASAFLRRTCCLEFTPACSFLDLEIFGEW